MLSKGLLKRQNPFQNKLNPEVAPVIQEIIKVIKGQDRVVFLSIASLLAKGHILLEGPPGTGKTTLVIALSRVLGCSFKRIQFTSDMLPTDIIGTTVFDQRTGGFVFKEGPIFHNIILADEINRATPRTQSALLEAMGEGQVSVEGITYKLPQPFFVVATENPLDHFGTFPLPDSQLDRFMAMAVLSYPDRKDEFEILMDGRLREKAERLTPILSPEKVVELQEKVERVEVRQPLLDYILEIATISRKHSSVAFGLSTRGALSILKLARAWAFIHNREFVIPDDIKTVAPFVMLHRIKPKDSSVDKRSIVDEIIDSVPVPE